MALSKVINNKNNIKRIIGLVAILSVLTSSVGLNLYLLNNNNKNNKDLSIKDKTISTLKKEIELLNNTNKELKQEADIVINSESNIRVIRDDLIDSIKKAVEDRDMEIKDIDILRALNSSEKRVMDEYIRIAALVIATMEIETSFKYITSENKNGTADHGIMQVNDIAIPHVKDALGENIDPINNKNHNVEAGSWEIYECYLKAKEKHPENAIWWTYVYYNRGLYVESTDAWKNPNNPNHKAVRNQANVRSNKFKESFEAYYEALSDNK